MQKNKVKDLEIDKRSLNKLISELLASPADKQLLEGIIKDLLPKLRTIERFNNIVVDKQEILFSDIVIEIEAGLEELKNSIKDSTECNNLFVKNKIELVVILLKAKEYEVDKANFLLIQQEINGLLTTLLAFDCEKIVEKFAKIKISQTPAFNQYTGKKEMYPKVIAEWKFSPTWIKWQKFNDLFFDNDVKYAWVAIELLFALERCWNDSLPEAEKDNVYHIHKQELDAVKNGSKKFSSFFNREKMISCLHVIMKKIFQLSEVSVTTTFLVNYELELSFSESDCCIRLEARSINKFVSEGVIIHTFDNSESPVYKLAYEVFKMSLTGDWIDIKKISTTSAIKSPSKFLERIKCDKVGSIFFEIVGSRIRLRKHPIYTKSLFIEQLEIIQTILSSKL